MSARRQGTAAFADGRAHHLPQPNHQLPVVGQKTADNQKINIGKADRVAQQDKSSFKEILTYKTEDGTNYTVGDTIRFGKGSNTDGNFRYVYTLANFLMPITYPTTLL